MKKIIIILSLIITPSLYAQNCCTIDVTGWTQEEKNLSRQKFVKQNDCGNTDVNKDITFNDNNEAIICSDVDCPGLCNKFKVDRAKKYADDTIECNRQLDVYLEQMKVDYENEVDNDIADKIKCQIDMKCRLKGFKCILP